MGIQSARELALKTRRMPGRRRSDASHSARLQELMCMIESSGQSGHSAEERKNDSPRLCVSALNWNCLACGKARFRLTLCPMKLRTDLAMHVTPEMVEEEALANQHRYKAEPRFSKTGVGTLLSASTKDSAAEVARSTARIQKAMRQLRRTGKSKPGKHSP